ncbi:hypothetical protein BJY04DRAFT_202350 [Aspergillus karnatakaensis]|uniref:uncharacterized protein n=1 Tax=Aspergillus karnatakaensis TaxID=1810916 RepID=UPI003CCE0EEF
MSERRRERREQRRQERRRTDPTAMSSVASELPERPKPQEVIEERASSTSPSEHIKTAAFRGVGRKKSVYDDYATFFIPEELRHSPDSHARRETPTMPTIVEIEPASETARKQLEEQHEELLEGLPSTYHGMDRLPWPVPVLRVIEPTPPHSINGSVRDAASPIITPSEPPEEVKEPERPTASRVSWGEHQTHEYEIPSTSSERSSLDLNERQRDFTPDEPVQETSIGYTYITPSADHPEDMHEEIEFAATVAAAAQAAGFDPSLITDDPIFRTRTSPPGSETRERSISPGTKVPRQQFHGFVEGEIESRAAPKSQFFTDQPVFADSAPAVFRAPVYSRKPVFKHFDQDPEPIEKEVTRHIDMHEIQDKPSQERRHESDSPGDEEFFMPGGFEAEESKPKGSTTEPISEEAPPSTVSYSETREPEPLKRTETLESEDLNDYPESTIADEDGSEGKKKKRRKRRSKRESDTFDDTASVTSVKSTDEKGKKSGGFLSSLFGSRVSEPVESKRLSEKPVSRDVQSEVGPRTSSESTRRRRHRSSSRGDSLDGRRRYDDELDRDDSLADKENINLESYKSSRQRREDRRKQRYGDMSGLGDSAEYEKV